MDGGVKAVREAEGCYASRRVSDDLARPEWLYREKPRGPWDSGWRLLAGDEAGDLNVPDEAVMITLDTIRAGWPELAAILARGQVGGTWRWDRASRRYLRVPASTTPGVTDLALAG